MKKTAAAILFLLMLAVFPTWGDGIMPPEPVLNCRAAVLMDYDTGTVLFSKNPSAEIPPASMTKLMTSFLLFEKIERGELSLDDIYTVSEKADFKNAPPRSSLLFLERGQRLTIKELVTGLLVVSGNDAATAVAELVAGGREECVALMNKRAAELGFPSFHFEDVSGYDSRNKVNPLDFCRFCRLYIKTCYDYFADIVGIETLGYPERKHLAGTKPTYGKIVQNNSNELIGRYDGVDGIKTGYIDESGYNVALTARRDGMRLVAVIMGIDAPKPSEGKLLRGIDGSALITYGFSTFRTFRPAMGEKLEIPVYHCSSKKAEIVPVIDTPVTVPYSRLGELVFNVSMKQDMKGEMAAGTEVGRYTLTLGDRGLAEGPMVLSEGTEKCSPLQNIPEFFRFLFKKSVAERKISAIISQL